MSLSTELVGISLSELERRYLAKVDRSDVDGCWPWTGARNGDPCSYGVLYLPRVPGQYRRRLLAHRLGWELNFGPIPDGMEICHHCDNPPCNRPMHWFLGTHQQNMADCAAKGRNHIPRNQGSLHGLAKLTWTDVVAIRRLVSEGHQQKDVAAQFGISRANTSLIVNRLAWWPEPSVP